MHYPSDFIQLFVVTNVKFNLKRLNTINTLSDDQQRALSFLNNDGNLRHNNVSVWSVFVNSSGEWKLGGLEYVSNVDGNQMPPVKLPASLEIYDPPEKSDASKLKLATKW